MTRPRWHDVLIVVALVGILAGGVWALGWWDDVWSSSHPTAGSDDAPIVVPRN